MTDLLLWQFIYLPLILAARFTLAINYRRGGWWRVLTPLALRAAFLDVYLNYTTCTVLLWDWPQKGETTISKRCKRLVFDLGWRGVVAKTIARFTNYFDADHIQLPSIPQKW